jgi:predicted peptidase
MVRPVLLLAFLGSVPAWGAPGVETGFVARSVTVGGRAYRHQVYVPPGFTPLRKWPVILFLHGNGESGDDGIRPTGHGIGPAIRRHPDRFPAVVVFPQARWRGVWLGETETVALAALDQAVREFNGDRRRLYLTGVSLGGYGTYQLAARHPGTFAAIAPVAGGVVPPPGFVMPPDVVALARAGDRYLAILETADPYRPIAAMIGKTPAWIVHGAADPIVPVTEARRMAAALKADGARVEYVEYPEQGHAITDRAYGDPALAAWLLAQRR